MAGEADDVDVLARHVKPEHARRLRRVDNKQHTMLVRDAADSFNIKEISRQI